MKNEKSKDITLGAGLGIVFGAAFGSIAIGLVFGAALGMASGPSTRKMLENSTGGRCRIRRGMTTYFKRESSPLQSSRA